MTRKTIIPSDWTPDDGYTVGLFCLPNSVQWKSCIAGQISDLTYGRQWDINTGNVKEAQEIAERIMASLMMDCGSTFSAIANALTQISLTIQQQVNCGCESVGTTIPETPDDGPPPVGPGTDFEDVEEYDNYKCQAAGTFMYSIIQSQTLLIDSNAQGYFGAAVAIVTGALLYVLNVAGFTALVGQLGTVSQLALALIQGEELSLENVRTRLQANEDDLLCALFCGVSTQTSIDQFMTIINGDNNLTASEQAYIGLYMQAVIINRLYSYQPELLNLVIEPDCSGCDCASNIVCPYQFQVASGTVLGSGAFRYDGLSFTLNSASFSGFHLLNFFVPCQVAGQCEGNQWCLEIVSTTINTSEGQNRTRRLTSYNAACTTNVSNYAGAFPPIGQNMIVGFVEFTSDTPFSVTFRIHGPETETDQPPATASCE